MNLVALIFLDVLVRVSLSVNVLGSIGLAAPLQCDICHEDEGVNLGSGQIEHYTNITVYRKEGDVVLGGLFPLQILEEPKGVIRYNNVGLVEMMAWAVDQVNADKDTLPGITLGYEIRDSFNNAPFASVQALELAARNVVGVIGPGSSKVAVHLASLLGSLSFPMVTYAATSDLLSESNRFPLFARTVPSDRFQCRALADLLEFYKWTFVSIIHSAELYGTEGANSLRELLATKGIYVDKFYTLPENYSPQGLDSMLENTLLKNGTHVNRHPASVIVLFATSTGAADVIRSAARLQAIHGNEDIFENVTWVASESWGSRPEIIKYFHLYNLGHFIGLKIKTFPVPKFIDYFRSLTPDTTSNPWFKHYYKEEYCGGSTGECEHNVYDQGIYDEPVLLAVEAFAHTLHHMLFETSDGETRAKAKELDQCVMVANPIQNTSNLYYLRNSGIGKCLFSELISGTFRTRTRKEMNFNSTTGDFEAMYAYLTLQKTSLKTGDPVSTGLNKREAIVAALYDIGLWNRTGISLDDPLVPFGGGSVPVSRCSEACSPGFMRIPGQIPKCWSCVQCDKTSISNTTNSPSCYPCKQGFRTIKGNTECEEIPPTFLKFSHPAAVILIILSILGIVLTVLTIVVFLHWRSTPLVKASGKELCIVLLVGLLTGFISSLFSIGEPSDPLCLMQLVTGTLFGTLTIVPIFLKTARVYALFFQSNKSAGRPPKYLLPVWQSMLCMLLVFIQMVILMFVIIWYPLKRKFEYPNTETVLLVCSGPNSSDTAVAIAVPVGYVLFFMVLSTILSYKVRKLPSNFQEAKFICLAQTIAIIVVISFGSSYFVTAGIWQTFLIAFASQIIALSFLILIFYKKVEIIVFYPERNKIVFEKDKINKLDMTRKERRMSFLTAQNCHMCGQALKPKLSTKAGLMSAANMLGIPKVIVENPSQPDDPITNSTSISLSVSNI